MILFLDDCPYRRRSAVTFLHRCMTVDRARIAIESLADPRVTEAYLDHDLGGFGSEVEQDSDGLTGFDVAKWIAANRTDLRVVVHSLNHPAAARMAGVMRDAGVEVSVVPFTSLLVDWRAA